MRVFITAVEAGAPIPDDMRDAALASLMRMVAAVAPAPYVAPSATPTDIAVRRDR